MPFVSKQQMRACYARRNSAIKAGRKPTWDCDEFKKDTNYASLPEYRRGGRKIYKGPQGGLYYINSSGNKVYIR